MGLFSSHQLSVEVILPRFLWHSAVLRRGCGGSLWWCSAAGGQRTSSLFGRARQTDSEVSGCSRRAQRSEAQGFSSLSGLRLAREWTEWLSQRISKAAGKARIYKHITGSLVNSLVFCNMTARALILIMLCFL
jgi:hypothetical protein